MNRKIIKQGHNTLTITLPSNWVRKLNLEAGDEVNIIEKENSLVINGKDKGESKSCEIDIRDFTVPLLWRYFQSAYRAGCDEIKVIFDSNQKKYEDAYHYYTTQFDYAKLGEKIPPKPAIAMIQEVANRFIGMEVIESGEGYCIVKDLTESSIKEFENSLRRIFLIIQQMFERLIEAIEKNEINDSQLCKEIHTIDIGVDKFVDYCARTLNRINGDFPEKMKPLIFSSLFLLELIGDEFKYIGKHMALSKKSVKECLPLLKLCKDHFEQYYHLYYKFSRELTIEFGKKDVELYQEHFSMKNKVKEKESRSIMKHIMMTGKFTLSLVELRIEMEYRNN
jgi:phosphate uptake regulator